MGIFEADRRFALMALVCLLVSAAWHSRALAASDVAETFAIAANGGTLLLTTDRQAFFVPPGDTADRQPAYTGKQSIVKIVAAGTGVVTLFSGGGAYYSPDGRNLGGGGWTQPGYLGSQRIVHIVPVTGGVLTRFSGGGVYRSPDGRNLGGGGYSVRAYGGTQQVVSMAAVNGGVVTLFSGGGAYFSPDGHNLGGGGRTVRAYDGLQTIRQIVEMPQGVQTYFSGGNAYLSRNGLAIGGGGDTLRLPAARTVATASAFGPRDSGSMAYFDGRWWIGSGFYRGNLSYFDLWASEDGVSGWNMTFGVASPETGPRTDFYEPYSPLVSFDGALWAIGSTVWRSNDGAQWTPMSVGPRRAVEDADAFVFRGKMVYIDPTVGQVFISPDGLDWSQRVEIPGFTRRCGAVITAGVRGRIWISGGGGCDYQGYYNDTWYSEDGIQWTQVVDPDGAPQPVQWSGRLWPCVVTTPSGMMWLFGGFRIENGVGMNLNDLWFSRDGSTWRRMTVSGTIEPRHAPSCYFDRRTNALMVVAGKGGVDPLNDNSRVRNDTVALDLPLDEFLP